MATLKLNTKPTAEAEPPTPPERPAPIPPPEPGTARFAAEALLAERFPAVFAVDPPVPLAIGIHHAIMWEIPELSGGLVSRVLQRYCDLPAYLSALIAGGPRYDLQGKPRGEITTAQIEKARTRLSELSP